MWWKKKPAKLWHQMTADERKAWLIERMADRKWFEVYFQKGSGNLERYQMRVWREGIEYDADDPMITCDYRESLWGRDGFTWSHGTYHFRLSSVYHAMLGKGERR